MSAYVVSVDTVRLLLAASEDGAVLAMVRDAYPHVDFGRPEDVRSVALRYVLAMNARAVLYRYPDATPETMPQSDEVSWDMAGLYRPLPDVDYVAPPFTLYAGTDLQLRENVAARVLGAAHCLRYQCCELPEFESTPAARWLDSVVWRASGALSEGWNVEDIRLVS